MAGTVALFLSGLLREINLRAADLPQDNRRVAEYEGGMTGTGARLSEIVRALCVLALFFLNFAHAPVAVASPSGSVLSAVADTGFCGSPPDSGDDHAPCHVCRIGGGADLPPPAGTITACFAYGEVGYADIWLPSPAGVRSLRPSARDPPQT